MEIEEIIKKFPVCPVCETNLQMKINFISHNDNFMGPLEFVLVRRDKKNFYFDKYTPAHNSRNLLTTGFNKKIEQRFKEVSVDSQLIIGIDGEEVSNPLFQDNVSVLDKIVSLYCFNLPKHIKETEPVSYTNSHFYLSANIHNQKYDDIDLRDFHLNIFNKINEDEIMGTGCNVSFNFLTDNVYCHLQSDFTDVEKTEFNINEDILLRAIYSIQKKTPKALYNKIKVLNIFS